MMHYEDPVFELALDGDGGMTDAEILLLLNAASSGGITTAAFWRKSDHPRDFDGRFTTDARVAVPIRIGPGSDAALTRDEENAASNYQFGTFKFVNDGLRETRGKVGKIEGSPGSSPTSITGTTAVRQTVTGLDAIMAKSKLTDGITVYRGIENPEKVFGSNWNDDVTGLTWREYGFSSTSPSVDTAQSYADRPGSVIMNISAPRGMGALLLDTETDTMTRSEVVLDRGIRYRVTRDRGTVHGVRMLDVEVLA